MITVRFLDSSALGYYAHGQQEGHAEVGKWHGHGLERLGLQPGQSVDEATLQTVFAGYSPATGELLARRMIGNRVGIDFTARPPKSVSVLYALANNAERAEIDNALDAARDAAIEHFETTASARRGAGGYRRVPLEGLTTASFRHDSSRAGDPFLHDHILIANLGVGIDPGVHQDDRQWSRIDTAGLVRRELQAASAVYGLTLRTELTTRLGVGWVSTERQNGKLDWQVEGLHAKATLNAFSKRSAAIEARLRAEGLDVSSLADRQRAALETRPAKTTNPGRTAEWKATARQAGIALADVPRDRSLTPSSDIVGRLALRVAQEAPGGGDVWDEPRLVLAAVEAGARTRLEAIEAIETLRSERGLEEVGDSRWAPLGHTAAIARLREIAARATSEPVDTAQLSALPLAAEERDVIESLVAVHSAITTADVDARSRGPIIAALRELAPTHVVTASPQLRERLGEGAHTAQALVSAIGDGEVTLRSNDIICISGLAPAVETHRLAAQAEAAGARLVVLADRRTLDRDWSPAAAVASTTGLGPTLGPPTPEWVTRFPRQTTNNKGRGTGMDIEQWAATGGKERLAADSSSVDAWTATARRKLQEAGQLEPDVLVRVDGHKQMALAAGDKVRVVGTLQTKPASPSVQVIEQERIVHQLETQLAELKWMEQERSKPRMAAKYDKAGMTAASIVSQKQALTAAITRAQSQVKAELNKDQKARFQPNERFTVRDAGGDQIELVSANGTVVPWRAAHGLTLKHDWVDVAQPGNQDALPKYNAKERGQHRPLEIMERTTRSSELEATSTQRFKRESRGASITAGKALALSAIKNGQSEAANAYRDAAARIRRASADRDDHWRTQIATADEWAVVELHRRSEVAKQAAAHSKDMTYRWRHQKQDDSPVDRSAAAAKAALAARSAKKAAEVSPQQLAEQRRVQAANASRAEADAASKKHDTWLRRAEQLEKKKEEEIEQKQQKLKKEKSPRTKEHEKKVEQTTDDQNQSKTRTAAAKQAEQGDVNVTPKRREYAKQSDVAASEKTVAAVGRSTDTGPAAKPLPVYGQGGPAMPNDGLGTKPRREYTKQSTTPARPGPSQGPSQGRGSGGRGR